MHNRSFTIVSQFEFDGGGVPPFLEGGGFLATGGPVVGSGIFSHRILSLPLFGIILLFFLAVLVFALLLPPILGASLFLLVSATVAVVVGQLVSRFDVSAGVDPDSVVATHLQYLQFNLPKHKLELEMLNETKYIVRSKSGNFSMIQQDGNVSSWRHVQAQNVQNMLMAFLFGAFSFKGKMPDSYSDLFSSDHRHYTERSFYKNY